MDIQKIRVATIEDNTNADKKKLSLKLKPANIKKNKKMCSFLSY